MFLHTLRFSVYNSVSNVLLITNGISMLIFICDVYAVCNSVCNHGTLMSLKLYFYISLKDYVYNRKR